MNFPAYFDGAESSAPGSRGEAESDGRKSLVLQINNLKSPNAPVYLAFYSTNNKFLSQTDRFKAYKFIPDGNSLTINVSDLKYGQFAIAGFQDLNNDGECNKSKLGIPQEPYGFSNDVKPKMKAPTFSQCMFTYNETNQQVSVTMIK